MAMYDVTPENMRGIANQIESLATDYGNLLVRILQKHTRAQTLRH